MMKIKTKNKMYIGALLEYIRKNKLRERYIRVMGKSRYIKVTADGDIYFDAEYRFKPADNITVCDDEDLTEETELSGVTTYIRKSNGIFPVYTASSSIRECLDSLTDVENEPLKIFNGITEIWNKDTGIPESGALEVDVE